MKKAHRVDACGDTADAGVCQRSPFSDIVVCKYLWQIHRLQRFEL